MRPALATLVLAAVCLLGGCAGLSGSTQRYRIVGASMEPTLRCAPPDPYVKHFGCSAKKADEVEVKPFAGAFHRGDIALFRVSAETAGCGGSLGDKRILRIVGLPRERLSYSGVAATGLVLRVNGHAVPEPYLDPVRAGGKVGAWRVPAGRYFLLGDARDQVCDSRVIGPVAEDDIVGKIVRIIRR